MMVASSIFNIFVYCSNIFCIFIIIDRRTDEKKE